MIAFFHIKNNTAVVREKFATDAWIVVEDTNEDELARLAEERKLNKDLLTDALDPHEIPRFESDGGILYVYARVPAFSSDSDAATDTLLIVIGKNFTATVSKNSLPAAIARNTAGSTAHRKHFALHILKTIETAYAKSLARIGKQVRGFRVHPEKVRERDILNFVTAESILNDYISSLVPLSGIYDSLLKTFKTHRDGIEDLKLANEQLVLSCKSNLKTIVNLREAYSALATSNLNRVIKVLTSLTIILTIPTIIASVFGMNVPLPLADSPFAVPIILAITALIVLAVFLFFKTQKWL